MEGEGEGEGDGEGEGEGEREVVDDNNPACEADERRLLVRDDEVDALHVYDLGDGAMVRRFPQGSTANVNIDNDDSVALQNGWGASDVALGCDNRLFVVGDRFLYQFQRSTLLQQPITGRQQVVLESFGSTDHVEVINDTVVTFGANVRQVSANAAVGENTTVLHQGDTYLGTTAFAVDDTRFVAASAAYGYVVIGADGSNPPTVRAFHDEEADSDRIHSFGSGSPPKGIAFDAATRTLLLGSGRLCLCLADPRARQSHQTRLEPAPAPSRRHRHRRRRQLRPGHDRRLPPGRRRQLRQGRRRRPRQP